MGWTGTASAGTLGTEVKCDRTGRGWDFGDDGEWEGMRRVIREELERGIL